MTPTCSQLAQYIVLLLLMVHQETLSIEGLMQMTSVMHRCSFDLCSTICLVSPDSSLRRDNHDEKALEANFQRERDVERKEQEARQHEQDQVYKAALRKWELQEM